VRKLLNGGLISPLHNLQPGGLLFLGLSIIDKLPSLLLKSVICSVFSVMIPSLS
jgi:hypothetical protein